MMSSRVIGAGVAAVLAAGALTVAASSPAAAGQVFVTPSIKGSGTISGGSGGPCTATNKSNSEVTGCGSSVAGNPADSSVASVTLTATPQASPAGHWQFVEWVGCQSPSGATCTMIFASFGTATFSPTAVFTDTMGPTIQSPQVAYSTSTDRTVTVSWSANEPLSAAQCSLDGGTYSACSSSGTHTVTTAEGAHTLTVKGTDLSGNVGSPSAAISFRVIDTTLVSGPADATKSPDATFVFASLTGTSFECSVDNVTLADCGPKNGSGQGSKSFTGLAEGIHTFRVRAKDGGDFDRVPVVRTWKIDMTPPTATLTPGQGPNEGALQAAATETFAFTSDEPGTFSCRLDQAAFAPCTSPKTVSNLRPGPHRFEVRAIDAAGNTSAAAARSWTVAGAPVDPRAKVKANAGPKTTKITKLEATGLFKGIVVKLTCQGGGCPAKLTGKGVAKTAAGPTLKLTGLVKKAALQPGAKLRLKVDDLGKITSITIKIRKNKAPKVTVK